MTRDWTMEGVALERYSYLSCAALVFWVSISVASASKLAGSLARALQDTGFLAPLKVQDLYTDTPSQESLIRPF
jgi:hypothetical protein